ncbi:MAG: Ig-like domain-containing protein [Nitrosotalea sp.]
MNKVLLLSVFAVLAVIVSVSINDAYATTVFTLDQTTCESILYPGSWNAATNTCLLTGTVNFGTNGGPHVLELMIPSGNTLEISNNGFFFDFDTITNNGTINLVGQGGLAVTNGGVLNNNGIINNDAPNLQNGAGTINNNIGATINNNGRFWNYFATINNRGTINAGSDLENQQDGTINNICPGVINGNIIDQGGQVVNQCSLTTTTTTVSSSQNPSNFGQSVTFMATISPSTATGTVTFTVDGIAQSPVTLSGGQAAFSSSSLSVGSHTITAAYSGDTNDATSTSTLAQTVNKGSVAILLTSSVSSDTFGQQVIFTATVSPVAPATSLPGGDVQFLSNGQDLGSPVTFSNGKATLVTTSLPAGTDYIVASYMGSSNFVPGISNSVVVKITLTYLQQKTSVITSLTGLAQSDRDDKNNIDEAIKQVTESTQSSLWQADGLHLDTKKGEQVFDDEKRAVNQLMDTVRHHKEPQAFDSTIEKNINTLVSVDQGIASTAISDASSGTPNADSVKDLAQAQKEIVMAAGETSVGHFDAAIDHYKNAWKQAQEALQDQTATVHH